MVWCRSHYALSEFRVIHHGAALPDFAESGEDQEEENTLWQAFDRWDRAPEDISESIFRSLEHRYTADRARHLQELTTLEHRLAADPQDPNAMRQWLEEYEGAGTGDGADIVKVAEANNDASILEEETAEEPQAVGSDMAPEQARRTSPVDVTTIGDLFDLDFIHGREGFRDHVYVPKDKNGSPVGQSGATIGWGLDLGQMDRAELDRLVKTAGLDPKLADDLAPYLGKTGEDALNLVEENPLTVGADSVRRLSIAKYTEISNQLINDYNTAIQDIPNSKPFNELPKEVQTVALSLAVQYGNLRKKTKKSWGFLTRNDIPGLVGELRNFRDIYPSRRNAEADYIEVTHQME